MDKVKYKSYYMGHVRCRNLVDNVATRCPFQHLNLLIRLVVYYCGFPLKWIISITSTSAIDYLHSQKIVWGDAGCFFDMNLSILKSVILSFWKNLYHNSHSFFIIAFITTL